MEVLDEAGGCGVTVGALENIQAFHGGFCEFVVKARKIVEAFDVAGGLLRGFWGFGKEPHLFPAFLQFGAIRHGLQDSLTHRSPADRRVGEL